VFGLIVMLLCLGYCEGTCGGIGMRLLWLYECYDGFFDGVSIMYKEAPSWTLMH
jgi:hypothetical protein